MTPPNESALPTNSQPTGEAIRIRGLRKVFGDTVALDGLDLCVPRGSFFGFLGPNGAGKTTTVQILIGLLDASAGQVEILGKKLNGEMESVKSLVGVVLDESVLFDRLRGPEFLEFVGRVYGLDRAVARRRAVELMGLFELDSKVSALIAAYSKGMRKRLALAAALIHRPQLFLLDEPFEGVDPLGARLMKEILVRQIEQGATVFLTSHVLEVVERLCDRIAIIDHGRIVAEGSIGELRAGEESLEDIFIRAIGGEKPVQQLDWL